ncbi:imidazolonepropionase [Spirochaetota bacterium]
MKATLLIKNIGELSTALGNKAQAGADMGRLLVVPKATIAVDIEHIVWAGPSNKLPRIDGPAPEIIDAGGKAVIPGFVDSHTHFVFHGYRDDEFFWRAAGATYMDIHARGGGIANTVKATREASLEQLLSSATPRLERMLELGVTTVEGKSGYGLDLDTELRQLETMHILDKRLPVDIIPTYMGPHSVPAEFKNDPSAYIDFILHDVLPVVAKNNLASFCDIFCEKGVFELDDSRRFLKAAKAAGFKLKLHADEIVALGGAGLAAEVGAVSADHLLKASPADLDSMARAGVVATCLPITAFTLKEAYANARMMIDHGLAVAIASDFNPGSCYSHAIPLAMALGVLYMNMSMEEVLTAMTLNGAAALGLSSDRGTIEKGKLADILILDAPSYKHLAYHVGMNLVDTVIKRGKTVSIRE